MNSNQNLIHSYLKDYCSRGWRVLPASPKKAPLLTGWPDKASSDLEVIKNWWEKFPLANVGIATGRESGFWVLDIDMKNDVNGLHSLTSAFKEFSLDHFPAHVRTPSGGLHIYFKWSDDLPITVASDVLPGIDIRGERGFVMAPPSVVHVDGKARSYKHLTDHIDIQDAPDWAIHLAKQTLRDPSSNNNKRSTHFEVAEVMHGVNEGNRDHALYRYACHLKGCDVPIDLALAFIKEASARCNPPFSEEIAIEKVQRAYTHQSANPTEIFKLK